MREFDREQFIESPIHRFAAFASDIGLNPGEVPDQVMVKGVGNGKAFLLIHVDANEFHYRQQLGVVTLKIFND